MDRWGSIRFGSQTLLVHSLAGSSVERHITPYGRRLLMTAHKNRQRFLNLICKASIAFAVL